MVKLGLGERRGAATIPIVSISGGVKGVVGIGFIFTFGKFTEPGTVAEMLEVIPVAPTPAVDEPHAHLVLNVIVPSNEVASTGSDLLLQRTHLLCFRRVNGTILSEPITGPLLHGFHSTLVLGRGGYQEEPCPGLHSNPTRD